MAGIVPARVSAQTATATLAIEARDKTGGLLPGVVVLLTNRDSGIGRKGTTTDRGSLVVPLLPAGTYLLAASLDGFKTEVVRDIRLQAAVKSTLSLVMTPGSYTEQVVVSADPTTLVIGNSTVGEVYDSQTLLTLPVFERDALQVAQQAPGRGAAGPGLAALDPGQRRAERRRRARGLEQLPARRRGQQRPVPEPPGREPEPRCDRGSVATPEHLRRGVRTQRRRAGQHRAQVRHAARCAASATSSSAHSALRRARPLRARGAADSRSLRKHQFGGTLGGPFASCRSFFFINVEGINAREADTRLARVPTLAERAGDFSASGVTIRDPFTGQPFPGNVIPAVAPERRRRRAAALYPAAESRDRHRQPGLLTRRRPERGAVHRQDRSPRLARAPDPGALFLQPRRPRSAVSARARNLPGFGISVLDQGHNLAMGATQALGTHVFNELRVGVNALRRENLPQSAGTDGFTALGIAGPSIGPEDYGYPTFVRRRATRRSATTRTCRSCAARGRCT